MHIHTSSCTDHVLATCIKITSLILLVYAVIVKYSSFFSYKNYKRFENKKALIYYGNAH